MRQRSLGIVASVALILAAPTARAQQRPAARNTTTTSALLCRPTFSYVVSLDTAIAHAQSRDDQRERQDTTLWTRRQHIVTGMVVGAVGFATVGVIETWNDWSTCTVETSGSGGTSCSGTVTRTFYRTATGVAFGALGALVGAAVGSVLRADSDR